MMRSIEFRAWLSDVKQYVHFKELKIHSTNGTWGKDVEHYRLESNDQIGSSSERTYMHDDFVGKEESFVLEQFTGLADKNTTKIFEGDIIEDSFGDMGIVIHKDGSFKLKHPHEDCFALLHDWIRNQENQEFPAVIIGNIHQNPELLT